MVADLLHRACFRHRISDRLDWLIESYIVTGNKPRLEGRR
jgi:hypothetical protein